MPGTLFTARGQQEGVQKEQQLTIPTTEGSRIQMLRKNTFRKIEWLLKNICTFSVSYVGKSHDGKEEDEIKG